MKEDYKKDQTTPRPWRVLSEGNTIRLVGRNGHEVYAIKINSYEGENSSNMQAICRAMNSRAMKAEAS